MEDNDQEIIVDEALRNRALDFAEEYFDDMRFENGCIVEKYFMCYIDEVEGAKVYNFNDDILSTLDADKYQYVVDTVGKLKAEGLKGEVDDKTHTVTISSDYVDYDGDNKSLLLHELIHVFEGLYRAGKGKYKVQIKESGRQIPIEVATENVPWIMRDALLMSLYWDLKERIPKKYPGTDLDKLIEKFGHFYPQEGIIARGGNHDILFYLKSLDLDLRLGYELGTVCDYDEYDKEDESKADESKGINE